MDLQRLQRRLEEIQSHIDSFKRSLADSEDNYQESLKLLTDPIISSALMEHHIVHTERQKNTIVRLEMLFDQVKEQLESLKSNI